MLAPHFIFILNYYLFVRFTFFSLFKNKEELRNLSQWEPLDTKSISRKAPLTTFSL